MAESARWGSFVLSAGLLALVPASAVQTRTIVIEGMEFMPATTILKRGDALVWVNRDVVPHTATARSAFYSGPIAAGGSWRFVPRTPGRYEVVCTLHPTMKATLVVE